MPLVFRERGYRFHFYSIEGDPREPLHVHVKRGDADAKVWVEPDVAMGDSDGFNAPDLNEIVRIAACNRGRIVEAWRDHFGD